MTDAAVIPAAYVKLSTMVDGTIRVVIDVEPTNRDAAFALFDRPGASLAIARLSDGSAVEHDRKAQAQPLAEPQERKPLSLASKVAIACGEPSFATFLRQGAHAQRWASWQGHASGWQKPASYADVAALVVRDLCGVTSRSEIVAGSNAESVWRSIEADYHHWQRTGAAA